jgi:hypothetical protein
MPKIRNKTIAEDYYEQSHVSKLNSLEESNKFLDAYNL